MSDNGAENVIPLKRKAKRVRTDWTSEWQTSDTGAPINNLHNCLIALRNHPSLHDILQFDELALAPRLIKPVPNSPPGLIPRHVSDPDVLMIQEEIQRAGLTRISSEIVSGAITVRAGEMRVHPVRDYLTAQSWDGRERLATMLSYYFGCEPPEGATDDERAHHGRYISRIGRMFMIAMVARVMRPGCQADYMLVLEGPQGVLKSSACRVLGGQWSGSKLPTLGAHADMVRVSMYLRGKWLIEVAELSSFSMADQRTLKDFITQETEDYIAKYGRREVKEPRQCLFIATTNEDKYLGDPTGARRYWPIKTGRIDIEALRSDRDQLFAEAVAAFKGGEPWWPDREFEAQHIVPEQTKRYEADVWQETIDAWIRIEHITRCTVTEVLRGPLSLASSQTGTREQRRVTAILRAMGWERRSSKGKDYYTLPL